MQVDLGECHKSKLKPGALDIAGSEIGRRGISAHIHCSSKLPTYIAHPTLINLKSKVIDTIGKWIALYKTNVLQDKDKQVFRHIYEW